MKKIIARLLLPVLLMACNNSGKNSVEKADSTNQANHDTAVKKNDIAIDENSSSFLVKVANSGMAEVKITSIAEQQAVYQPIKDFAAMLNHDHTMLNDNVKSLAAQKNVVLPDSISAEKQDEIDQLQKKTGKDFDKAFISAMIKNHQASIDMFEQTKAAAGDADVSSFADKTLPTLRAHLDSAKALQKRYW